TAQKYRNDRQSEECYLAFSGIYEQLGNQSKALSYYKKYSQLRDSLEEIANIEKQRQLELIARQEAEARTAGNEKIIELWEKDKIIRNNELRSQVLFRNSLIIGSVLLVIIFVMLMYIFRNMEARKRAEIQRELNMYMQKALAQQMNPHFIFNSLNSIQLYIQKNEREASAQYLSKFSRLVRKVLDNSQHQYIPVKEEIEALTLYIELESMRFREKFNHSISISDEADVSDERIPTLLIQPFVENAIRHGLMHKDGKGELIVEVSRNKDNIVCVVEDNGIGRKEAGEILKRNNPSHPSLGTQLIQKRIDMINALNKQPITVNYTDKNDGTGAPAGTRVEIRIPVV
ncbi:MAG: histidine kinase, partial [Bacteroidetes bacterium]|nr:histidine kinase [Bacteroidota bacterium]